MSADPEGSDMPADPGELDMYAESAGKDSMNSKKSASTSNNSNSSKITERTGTDRSYFGKVSSGNPSLLEMREDKFGGIGTVTFKAGLYGGDGGCSGCSGCN